MSKRKHDDSERKLKSSKEDIDEREKSDRAKRSKETSRDTSEKASALTKDDKKSSSEASKSKRDRDRSEEKEKKRDRGKQKEKSKRASDNVDDNEGGNGAEASGGDVSLSIEETNKLRAKLGLKPLEMDSGSSKAGKSDGGSKNKVADRMVTNEVNVDVANAAEKKRTDDIKQKLEQRKEARKIEQRLARMKTLGESSDEEGDTTNWIIRQRTMEDERKLAAERARMFEDLDNELAGLETGYSASQAAKAARSSVNVSASGLKVEHSFDQIEAGTQLTLTLKDAPILSGSQDESALGPLDGEEDVLVSVDLLEHERGERNRTGQTQLTAWKRGLASLDDDQPQALLSKYDAPKAASFRIGQSASELPISAPGSGPVRWAPPPSAEPVAIGSVELRLARDFMNDDEMGARFKKRRTKTAKSNLRRDESAPAPASAAPAVADFGVDEEAAIRGELESLLERTRQTKLRELKSESQSESSRRRPVSEFISLPPQGSGESGLTDFQDTPIEDAIADEEQQNGSGLDFNATHEFCKKVAAKQKELARRRVEIENELGSVLSAASKNEPQEVEDMELANDAQSVADAQSDDDNDTKRSNEAVLEEEPVLNSGVAAAIQVAFKKGYLDARAEQKSSGTRLTDLEAQQFQVEQKRYDDIDAKFTKRDRFASSAMQPFREKEGYKPAVKLEYVDETGKKIDAKTEFQRLSWRFHGKTSGKNKLEKQAAKEKRVHALKAMDASDTPLGTADKLRRKLEQEQQPYLLLSGAAPSSSKS